VVDSTITLKEQQFELTILIPVFNDWNCIQQLLIDLERTSRLPKSTKLVIIDDGSTETPAHPPVVGKIPVEVIRLGSNLGHQRAIAAGLVSIAAERNTKAVIIMDSDGEDVPSDCETLYMLHLKNPSAVIVARRGKRRESIWFRTFYALYLRFFHLLTGKRLDFGNFSLLSRGALERFVLMPELWNHYPATIMKSRLNIIRTPLDRGVRFEGKSRMNFIDLVNHGLAGVTVFADIVYTRLLIWSIAASGFLGTLLVSAIVFRLITEKSLPGWLALAGVAIVIALFQIVAALVVVSFLTLSLRAQLAAPPSQLALAYISGRSSLTNFPNVKDE